jgi:two-component system sensor histidine kinase RegB
VAEDSKLIRQEVERCRAILSRMSVEGAEPAGEALERLPVSELFRAIRVEFAGQSNIEIDARSADGLSALTIPRHAVEQALIALVKNGRDASPLGSPVSLRAQASAGAVTFVIVDQGHGMSQETLRHVGEPFFTTKEPGKGMGLGVFLVRTLAERLDGRLRFESRPEGGTIVSLELPADRSVEKTGQRA